MGEIFKFEVDGSTGRLVAVAAPSMGGCTRFFKVGLRGLETHHVFLRSP
jgi:hypothetical protein